MLSACNTYLVSILIDAWERQRRLADIVEANTKNADCEKDLVKVYNPKPKKGLVQVYNPKPTNPVKNTIERTEDIASQEKNNGNTDLSDSHNDQSSSQDWVQAADIVALYPNLTASQRIFQLQEAYVKREAKQAMQAQNQNNNTPQQQQQQQTPSQQRRAPDSDNTNNPHSNSTDNPQSRDINNARYEEGGIEMGVLPQQHSNLQQHQYEHEHQTEKEIGMRHMTVQQIYNGYLQHQRQGGINMNNSANSSVELPKIPNFIAGTQYLASPHNINRPNDPPTQMINALSRTAFNPQHTQTITTSQTYALGALNGHIGNTHHGSSSYRAQHRDGNDHFNNYSVNADKNKRPHIYDADSVVSYLTDMTELGLNYDLSIVGPNYNSNSHYSRSDKLRVNTTAVMINTGADDFSSVTGTNTMISHVSSVADPFIANNVLIVMLGIGEYDSGLHNLRGVKIDYQNIINTFVKYWKYKVLYKTRDMEVVYTNDINVIDQNPNYKLYWTCDDIAIFVEQARQHVVKNKHNGMIFLISSHGDRDNVIYDSNIEEYDLEDIFKFFVPEWQLLLETYKETKEESNHLFQIPKIFCIDCCRGDTKAKLTKVIKSKSNQEEKNDDKKVNEKKNDAIESLGIRGTEKEPPNDNSKSTIGVVEDETFRSKGISKDESKVYSAQMANFCKVWANTNGFSVADGSENGGLFLRNISKLFKDRKFIASHKWNDIIIKLREKTKKDASLIGTFNFTQLVENESTLERPLVFVPLHTSDADEDAHETTDHDIAPQIPHGDISSMEKTERKEKPFLVTIDFSQGLGDVVIPIPIDSTKVVDIQTDAGGSGSSDCDPIDEHKPDMNQGQSLAQSEQHNQHHDKHRYQKNYNQKKNDHHERHKSLDSMENRDNVNDSTVVVYGSNELKSSNRSTTKSRGSGGHGMVVVELSKESSDTNITQPNEQ